MFRPARQAARLHILAYILTAAAIAGLPASSFAQPAGAKKSAAPADEPGIENRADKLDVTDLEKKYWAAKDTDFSVVQNRTYSKAGRFALTASYGSLINDPFSKGTNISGSLNYYFTERYGVELNYTDTNSSDAKGTTAFKTTFGGATPNHGKIAGFYGAAFNWVPLYAKMSVLNTKILYFDMAVSPGVGVTSYDAQVDTGNIAKTAPTLTFDVTQSVFLNKHFALRLDYKNRWFQEDILAHSTTARGTKVKSEMNHTTLLLFGATYFF